MVEAYFISFHYLTSLWPCQRYMTIIGDTAGVGTTVSCNRYSGMLNANGDVLSTREACSL